MAKLAPKVLAFPTPTPTPTQVKALPTKKPTPQMAAIPTPTIQPLETKPRAVAPNTKIVAAKFVKPTAPPKKSPNASVANAPKVRLPVNAQQDSNAAKPPDNAKPTSAPAEFPAIPMVHAPKKNAKVRLVQQAKLPTQTTIVSVSPKKVGAKPAPKTPIAACKANVSKIVKATNFVQKIAASAAVVPTTPSTVV